MGKKLRWLLVVGGLWRCGPHELYGKDVGLPTFVHAGWGGDDTCNSSAVAFSYGQLAGANLLGAFAGEPFRDANAVLDIFAGVTCLGRFGLMHVDGGFVASADAESLPALSLRWDRFWRCRVGEASNPGPAGRAAKLRKQLGIPKPVSRKDIQKVCRDVLRGLLQELGGQWQPSPMVSADRAWHNWCERDQWDGYYEHGPEWSDPQAAGQRRRWADLLDDEVKAWSANSPIGFATSASTFAKELDESSSVAWVVTASSVEEAEEIFDIFTADQDDEHTVDMSLLFPVSGDSTTLPEWAEGAQLVTVPGRSAGKLCTKKHWLVVGGTAPPTLNTRSTEAFVVKRPPLSVSALRAFTTVVRVTFDRAFGEDAWPEVLGRSRGNFIRLRTREAAVTMWKASGQLSNGTRWFVDLLGDARDDPSVADVGVAWMPWSPEESYASYASRVAGQAKLGVVLGRGLGLRLKRSDPAFVRQPSLWRLRAVPRNLLLQDVTELISAMGFEDAVVCTRHHNRKHYDWCFKATRQDQLQVVTQTVQWNPECCDLSEVTAIKEQARRGTRSRPTERLAEPRTISFNVHLLLGGVLLLMIFLPRLVVLCPVRPWTLRSALDQASNAPLIMMLLLLTAKADRTRCGASMHENDAGGNCFYLALAVLDTGNKPRHHRQIRRWIHQLLLHHAQAVTWEDFLAEQSQNCSWGGALEFHIFCKGLDMRGWLIDDGGTVYSFFPEGCKGFLVLHFDRERQHFRAFTEVVEQHVQARHKATGALTYGPSMLLRGGAGTLLPTLSDCADDDSVSLDTAPNAGCSTAGPEQLTDCSPSAQHVAPSVPPGET
ncbi:unnamed protein product [Symbiodinium sp. CCMP2592]|nr:unnamed protein product [Symbiodinium sp. CCMP2592]